MNMPTSTRSIFRSALHYLKFARPTEPNELERIRQQRKQISEKLTLSQADRDMIARLDETIEMLYNLNK